jgi:hypothetical protein
MNLGSTEDGGAATAGRVASSRGDAGCVAILGLIWIGMTALVHPFGDFPLNDDWVYGLAVRSILEHGEFRMPSPASANLYAQAYWGALFCLPFGFSFTALRISTLMLGFVGVALTFALARQLGATRPLALAAAALVAVNPLYFALSNTFMTDVPFFAVSAASLYCLVRWAHDADRRSPWPGLVLALVAILIRQAGIILPLGFAFAYLRVRGVRWTSLAIALLPVLAGAVVHFAFQAWLQQTGRTPAAGEPPLLDSVFGNLLAGPRVPLRVFIFFAYAGLFALPMLALVGWHVWRVADSMRRRAAGAVFGAGVVLSTLAVFAIGTPMPLVDNILNAYGVGPLTLSDTYFLRMHLPIVAPWLVGLWYALTVAAVFGAALFAALAVDAARSIAMLPRTSGVAPSMQLVGAAVIAYGVLACLALRFFLDRYALIVLLGALLVAAFLSRDAASGPFMTPGVAVLGVLCMLEATFSVLATRDYLDWNRTRWVATSALLAEGIPRTSIDGGYEFNGWLGFDPAYRRKQGKSPWWVVDDAYVIASGPLPGFSVYRSYPVRRGLTDETSQIIVLRRDSP